MVKIKQKWETKTSGQKYSDSNMVGSNIVQKDKKKKWNYFYFRDSNMVGASNIVQRGPF